jgi:hypothetical protein
MHLSPRLRLDRDVRLRMDRSMERLHQLRVRQFELRDRAWRRQLETQERSMARLQERMGRLRLQGPLRWRRHLRTI